MHPGTVFGADRIYDVLNALDLFPPDTTELTKLLFINFGEKEASYCLPLLQSSRKAGIYSEIYPDSSKLKKQMGYANSRSIPFVAIAGENEINTNSITIKDMVSGEQITIKSDELINYLKGKNIN